MQEPPPATVGDRDERNENVSEVQGDVRRGEHGKPAPRWNPSEEAVGMSLISNGRLPDALAARLEALIDTGEIGAGDRLPPERDLAAMFNISRASIREALNQLVLKGLIDRRPGRGTIVLNRASGHETALRVLGRLGADLSDALDFRSVIEPAIAAHAARRRTRADLIRLEEVVRFMDQEDSLASFSRLDQKFHGQIARSCHNPLLVALNTATVEWMAATRQEALQTQRRRKISRSGHRAIYRAIAAGDPDAASRAMAEHIGDVGKLLLGDRGKGKGR
jgi:GntR family transcriptional repressor for pyruvate dehydrogenase complex